MQLCGLLYIHVLLLINGRIYVCIKINDAMKHIMTFYSISLTVIKTMNKDLAIFTLT